MAGLIQKAGLIISLALTALFFGLWYLVDASYLLGGIICGLIAVFFIILYTTNRLLGTGLYMGLAALFFYLSVSVDATYLMWGIISEVLGALFLILVAMAKGNKARIIRYANYLKHVVGEQNVSIQDYEKKLYSRDSAPLPGIVMMLFNTTPDLVIKTKDENALAQVFDYANKRKIPLTLAAGKTSLMAGTIPIVGGIVIDLMENDGVVELDETNLQVTVKASTVWENLYNWLELRGYTLGLYPSSSPAAAIGGYISTGGIGIGAFKNGGICDQIVDIKFLSMDGKIFHTNPLKLGTRVGLNLNMLGLGTEGTFGIVLEATLRIFPKPEKRTYHTITFDEQENMIGFLDDLVKSDLTPFHVEWKDKYFVNLLRELDFEFAPQVESLVFCALDGSEVVVNAEEEVLRAMVTKWEGVDQGHEHSIEEWNERFYPMRVKRLGPNIMGGETLIPTKNVAKALARFEDAADALNANHGVEGSMGPRTSTTALCDIMVDERKFNYLFSVGALIDVQDVGFQLQGRNYTFNAWNSFFINRIFNKPHRDINVRLKDQFDPQRLLQSYKTVDTPKTILRLKFRPFMFTAALNMLKLINNTKLIGGLLLGVGAFLTLFTLFMQPNFFADIVAFLLGSETQTGLIEPMIDVNGLLNSFGLSGLVYGLIGILDYRIAGVLSWGVFLGIVLVYIGAALATKNAKNGALLSWLFIGVIIIKVLVV